MSPRNSHATSGPGAGTGKPSASPADRDNTTGIGTASATISTDNTASGTTILGTTVLGNTTGRTTAAPAAPAAVDSATGARSIAASRASAGIICSSPIDSRPAKGGKEGADRTRWKRGSNRRTIGATGRPVRSASQPSRVSERRVDKRTVNKRKAQRRGGKRRETSTTIDTTNPIFSDLDSVVSAPSAPPPNLQGVRLFILARAHRYAADPAATDLTLDQAVREFVSLFSADTDIDHVLTDEVMEVLSRRFGGPVLSGGSGGAGDRSPTLPRIRDTVVRQVLEDRLADRHEAERRARPDTYTPYRQCSCRVLPLPCWQCGYGHSHEGS
ncbi:uncharacterized protein PpBr36_10145 [Pyricularia pennisetigena]|uniref:uncharacterized protein n=1 Tax=Pyricularia pennisetigena TaxID=1578925 RepID=UPI0011520444|nr:uncharacterized protein PpBr36_10145 [Pyricularia pennisetigena]TLS21428.1 hypothetical protein PpBr36_10145 [Pyricularia pennisetigena]